jgi:YegS/Rv2252/BmrU family lipid kinase
MSLPYGKRVHVIINPAAGQDRPVLGKLNSVFQPAGVDWDVFITKTEGDGRRLAEQAVAAGADVVAAHGGDGTISEVANGLVGSSVPLAILPGGTANVLSIELGIPNDLAEAAALICGKSRLCTVDVGQIDQSYFVQRAGVGLEAQIVVQTDRDSKVRLGWLAYALSALHVLSEPPAEWYLLTLDGRQVEAEGLACFIANAGSLGLPGFNLAPTIDMSDGLLDVVIIRQADLTSLLSLAVSLIEGSSNLGAIQHWQVREVSIQAKPPQVVQSDGEIIGQTPFTARILPQALQIIIPETGLEDASQQ